MAEFTESSESLEEAVVWSKLINRDDWSTKLAFANRLRQHGWGVVIMDDSTQYQSIHAWETTFSKVFSLPKEMLEYAGLYRGEQGVSIGYRHDEERKFIECRMTSTNEPNPNYLSLEEYGEVVKAIYDVLCPIGEEILRGIARLLGLDDRVFVDLTDCRQRGRLPLKTIKRKKVIKNTDVEMNNDAESPPVTIEEVTVPALSSSLLRICKYESEEAVPSSSSSATKNRIAFGAHTDTSFLTLGLCSSNPAIEMADLYENRWISPEKQYPPNSIMVFVGEFLQILTKDRFMASVHRVGIVSSGARISCPLIIREHPEKEINFHHPEYHHPDGEEALSEDKVPSFDGMTLKMIHKLLEIKRKKCFERNGSTEGNWVLSSFPIARMPNDDEVDS